ncbi:DUF6302 family protein [Streptomyces caeruleatus]|uniref:Uncharacterized protein n=1 Tax=Streptomyces caeruleatus TaxID=661399 RepID=A0A101U5U9_9ACTN|nr:DUF6302 family protein [Streptomyces caeruleatus]KUO04798.1 hypothetical protein AQJ67_09825 [Streptomyces caeruleatus]
MITGTRSALNVRLLPAGHAYDYEYFRARLADTTMLNKSVAVCLFRAPLLAVPVGGARRGGYMSLELVTLALEVRSLLDARSGFPNLRVRWSPYRDTCHVVEWGAESPMWDDAARGRFYGYSETAIDAYLREHAPPSLASAYAFPSTAAS